jgi:hypothetical protein
MTDLIQRQSKLQINAWNGSAALQDALPSRTPWAQVQKGTARLEWLAPPAPVDHRDWTHPDVGWGVILPENDNISAAEKARGDDAPKPIRDLLAARKNAPVLRYRPDLQQGHLRRYYPDMPAQDLSVSAPNPGVGKGRIPQYLLIVGSPTEIPWAVQYALNMSTFVGRLDLPEAGLRNYVDALISDWAGQITKPQAPVVWSVDYGLDDITWLMAEAIAGKLWQKFENDADLTGRVRFNAAQATGAALSAALLERTPSLVVTTSHGMTAPLDNADALKSQLGFLVDVTQAPIGPQQLAGWQPSGAIWYAHACCSAGTDSESRYKGLLPPTSAIGEMLEGVARAAGSSVAPLPKALLGAPRPLRAFVGHVEPTFDWTLRDPNNQQVVTHVLNSALYNSLYQQDRRTPIGYALKDVYKEAGAFYGAWQDAIKQINDNVPGMRDWALYRQLVAMDRQTMVILGDPTVAMPPLHP